MIFYAALLVFCISILVITGALCAAAGDKDNDAIFFLMGVFMAFVLGLCANVLLKG